MPAATNSQTRLQAVAVAAVTATTLLGFPYLLAPSNGTTERGTRSPVVAAAWAQLNCDPGLQLRDTVVAIDRDILLDGAAAYEAERERLGLGPACTKALLVAKPVIDTDAIADDRSDQPRHAPQVSQAIAAN